jgi:HSP20 family molecular chaperone IbpA
MTARDSKGFFERLTGARILDRDETEEQHEQADPPEQDIEAGGDQDESYLEEALEERDQEPEETYSDEDTGAGEGDEQEGQLTVDVFQDDTNIVIQSTIAGVAPDNLDVSITNDMVTIRGERKQAYAADQEDYFYQECYWGTFSRSIILPVEIDADRAEAKIKNGILTIRIPKANTAMTRKLKVKAS